MAHSKHIQGQNVNLLIGGSVIAASESCDFSLTANTVDSAAKDDVGLGEWNNPTFDNYSWNASNQSFIVNFNVVNNLLDEVVNGDAEVTVLFQVNNGSGSIALTGSAIITSLEIDTPSDGKAKINISMEGSGALSNTSVSAITPTSLTDRYKGKPIMIAIEGSGSTYHTIMCSTNHKLTVSIQTTDITDKDANDGFLAKEVTGRSVKLSTENAIPSYDASDTGISAYDIIAKLKNGNLCKIKFGYDIDFENAEAEHHDWGAPANVLISGTFLITSFSMSGQVKQKATYNAEFTCLGKPTVTSTSTQAEE